ncbi:MAG: acyl-CoA thioesterase [Planctomycetes bacterium]|nr:acyl-CoA thioesterase [Planctomycetota bacterium]
MPVQLAYPSFISAREPVHVETIEVRVAFRDCDPMGVLWHGNYLAYCELARNQLGERIGFGIARLRDLGLFAPVVRSQVLHQAPARPDELLRVEAALYASAQPRLYHRYRLSVGGRAIALGETEQVLTDQAFGLLLSVPSALTSVFSSRSA